MNASETQPIPLHADTTRRLFNPVFLKCFINGALNTGGAQVIRLAGNLVLTRLLFPEAFGIMALVTVVLVGLEMFSDVGVSATLIQRKKEPSLKLLQTAWTVQVIRGFTLWAIAALAAFPLAAFYDKPELALILPVSAITLIFAGFKSTSIHLTERNLNPGPLMRIDLGGAILGLIVAAAIAWVYPTIWALVICGLVSVGTTSIASWWLPYQVQHRFKWDRECLRELVSFGRWIFLATLLTFVSANIDRITLGKILTAGELGLYTIAFFLSQSVAQLIVGVSNRVIFPILSREKDESRFAKLRNLFLFGSLLPMGGLFLLGPWLIGILYSEQYAQSADLLLILTFSTAPMIVRALSEPVILSRGRPKSKMLINGAEALLLVGCLLIAVPKFGFVGYLVGYSVGQYLSLIPTAIIMHREGMKTWLTDLSFICAICAFAAIGFLIYQPSLTF
ncbi:MAG: oligosaccharide flippase family protein [Verrucomicrobiota bacterium]